MTDGPRRNPIARLRGGLAIALAACSISALCLPAHADGTPLPPQTRLRVTVLQWMPVKGVYENWTALGGEFVVSDAGTITLPVVGTVQVRDLDDAALADEVADRIQKKTGLVNKPDTTVEVVEFPPIYVVGGVNKPGEYKFRTGLTVLQAVALGGGQVQPSPDASKNEIQLVGTLQGIQIEMLRSEARIARLQAETAGATTIDFPPMHAGVDSALAAQVYGQEKIIFAARANELDRQTKSLSDLRELFTTEISVLEEKNKAADLGIAAAEKELNNVKMLVDKGLAIASRQSDLERALADYRGQRLDQVTAIMRARQNITEATRSLEGLHDKQKTDVASEMQNEEANLDQLKLKRDTSQRLLLDQLAQKDRPVSAGAAGQVTYTIRRRSQGSENVFDAAESTLLTPGDVVAVQLPKAPVPAGLSDSSADAAPEKSVTTEASQ